MENLVRVFVLEDADGKVEPSAQVAVDLFHHHDGELLVRDAVDERVLQHVRERAVSDVVHEDGSLDGLFLGVEDIDALLA